MKLILIRVPQAPHADEDEAGLYKLFFFFKKIFFFFFIEKVRVTGRLLYSSFKNICSLREHLL